MPCIFAVIALLHEINEFGIPPACACDGRMRGDFAGACDLPSIEQCEDSVLQLGFIAWNQQAN
jgi:hypothetical protein